MAAEKRLFWLLTTALLQVVLCSASCPKVCSCLGAIVDCSKSGITEVPPDLPKWVEQLDLSQNPDLNLTPGVFNDLPQLATLYLQKLGLDRLPPLGHLPSLRALFLGNNRVTSVESLNLQGLPHLQDLDLSKNKLTALTSKAFANVTLVRLNLSRNLIARLDQRSFRHLRSLAELKLSRNLLTPTSFNRTAPIFTNLTNLRLLDLNGNKLRSLQGLMFKDLKKLKILKLRRNEVATFSDGVFYGLESIDKLYLDFNNITVVHKGLLFGLRSLSHLGLTNNHIDSIRPDAWKSTQRLVSLELDNNRLVSLREGTFRGLGDLTTLALSHNHLAYIQHNTFHSTTSLTTLDLSHNQLRWSVEDNSGAFSSLGHLKSLSLAYNNIETVHAQTFVPLTSLTTLDLLGNQLRTLPHNPFSTLTHLSTISLNTSSLVCDCHLTWLPAWLISLTSNSSTPPSSTSSITVFCNYPASLRERQVVSLRSSDFSCESSPRPEIKHSPEDQIVLHGTNVTLACVAQAGTEGDQPKFMWRKNNQLLVDLKMETLVSVVGGDGEGGAMHNVTSLLQLVNVSEANSGEYQCVVRNHYGASYSKRAKIQVHIFPYFTKTPSDNNVRAGEVARLECVASGSPAPIISLLKDGGDDFPAARERRIHVFKNESIFFIKPVRPHDEGQYTCLATNDAGIAKAHANVSVHQIPEFTKPPKDEFSTLGDNALLECQGTGLPVPRVRWTRDGAPVEESERYVLAEDAHYLIIKETIMEDVGTYTCELTNILGTARARVNLSIREMTSHSKTTGIVVIVAVCCVVFTSLVWVCIIYQTRKRAAHHRSPRPSYSNTNGVTNQRYPTAHPVHLTPDMVHHTFTPLLPGSHDTYRGQDSSSEHSSGKDSGTGDSAGQRSSEDLLPLDLNRPGLRRSLLACQEPTSPSPGLRGTGDGGEVCDELPPVSRPRLSTFSPQQYNQVGLQYNHHHHHHHLSPGSYSPGLYTASLRRGSHSRLMPVSTPVTPSSTLPRPIPAHQSTFSPHKPTSSPTTSEASHQHSPRRFPVSNMDDRSPRIKGNNTDMNSPASVQGSHIYETPPRVHSLEENSDDDSHCHTHPNMEDESVTLSVSPVSGYNPRASVCSAGDHRSELDLRIESPEVRFKNTIPTTQTLEPR